MIGSLLYLTVTRPDMKFAVCLCAHFQALPCTSHRKAVKWIKRYLRFTPEFGLWYSASSSLSLCGYSDADFAGCRLDRKSTSGTCQFLGSSLVSWSSRKQSNVVQSTTEAEYVAAASCCSQLLWMIATLRDFGLVFTRVPLLCDSTSAISVAKNPVLHSKTKHIDVRFHFLRDHYEKGDIDLFHVDTQNQLDLQISLQNPSTQHLLPTCEGSWVFASLFRGGKLWFLYYSFRFFLVFLFLPLFLFLYHTSFALHLVLQCIMSFMCISLRMRLCSQ